MPMAMFLDINLVSVTAIINIPAETYAQQVLPEHLLQNLEVINLHSFVAVIVVLIAILSVANALLNCIRAMMIWSAVGNADSSHSEGERAHCYHAILVNQLRNCTGSMMVWSRTGSRWRSRQQPSRRRISSLFHAGLVKVLRNCTGRTMIWSRTGCRWKCRQQPFRRRKRPFSRRLLSWQSAWRLSFKTNLYPRAILMLILPLTRLWTYACLCCGESLSREQMLACQECSECTPLISPSTAALELAKRWEAVTHDK